PLFRQDWVVYAKRPFGGPEHVLHYLARYTHRVAISNHRLLSVADGKVTFRYKDYAHGGKQRKMTVTAEEFLRRFLLHVLPRWFVRIRFSGFLANRRRKQLLPLCLQLLGSPQPNSSLTLRKGDRAANLPCASARAIDVSPARRECPRSEVKPAPDTSPMLLPPPSPPPRPATPRHIGPQPPIPEAPKSIQYP